MRPQQPSRDARFTNGPVSFFRLSTVGRRRAEQVTTLRALRSVREDRCATGLRENRGEARARVDADRSGVRPTSSNASSRLVDSVGGLREALFSIGDIWCTTCCRMLVNTAFDCTKSWRCAGLPTLWPSFTADQGIFGIFKKFCTDFGTFCVGRSLKFKKVSQEVCQRREISER